MAISVPRPVVAMALAPKQNTLAKGNVLDHVRDVSRGGRECVERHGILIPSVSTDSEHTGESWGFEERFWPNNNGCARECLCLYGR